MTRDQAKALVLNEINRPDPARPEGLDLVVIDDETIERDFGWVFFYESRRFLEAGRLEDKLAGNAPYIVDRRSGVLHITGTAHPIEYYISHYERHGTPHI
jgi:hypothetical protein